MYKLVSIQKGDNISLAGKLRKKAARGTQAP